MTKTGGNTKAIERAIDVMAAFVADFEPGRYSSADAAFLVDLFVRAERLCNAGKTLAANRVAESNRPFEEGHRSAAHWLAGVSGESVGEAMDVLRLGQALEDQPGVDDAYRQGELSRARAKLVSGAVKVNPQSEGEILEGAKHDSLRQLKERCLRAKAQGRSAAGATEAYEAIRKSRYCRTWTDPDGAFRLDARLTPDAGAGLLVSLSSESNRIFERSRKSGLHESRDAYCADSLVALVTGRGSAKGPHDGPSGGDRSDDGRAAGAEAVTECRAPDPTAMVHLRVDLAALRRGSVGKGEVCEIPGVGPVPLETARSLMGDAITKVVIANGVDVTTICNLGRSIPAALKSALIERDPTCVVPTCDVAHGLEFDHWRTPFVDGGTVSLDNLARLCGHHHYQRTHKGFRLAGGPGRWRWAPPSKASGEAPRANRTKNQPPGSIDGNSEPFPDDGDHELILFTLEE